MKKILSSFFGGFFLILAVIMILLPVSMYFSDSIPDIVNQNQTEALLVWIGMICLVLATSFRILKKNNVSDFIFICGMLFFTFGCILLMF